VSIHTVTLTDPELAELRALLRRIGEENKADLQRAHSTLATLSAAGLLADPSMRMQGTQAEYMVQDASSILEKVEDALKRMAEGRYGMCTSCGNQIPFARLRARPYAPTCVTCS